MANKREIEINGYIGDWYYSMGYVKSRLDELGEGAVSVKVTSYGGDINHALKIKNLFETHGDVTVDYIGFSASAATLIGHGAKKTRIYEDAFYLIHKPMVWVETWGFKNEDELQQAIDDMKAQKKDAETITLTLAQDYVKSRGMSTETVMKLLKEARWIPAKEAVELGLVDELIPAKSKRPAITSEAIAMMSAAGLPPIPGPEDEPAKESVGKIIRDEISKFFTPTNNSQSTMDKQYSFLNKTLNVEGVEVKDDKVTLTVAQILALNNQLKANEEAVANAGTATTQAETAKAAAENSLTDVLNQIDTIDPTVKAAVDAKSKVAAIRTKLAARPGTAPETPQGDASKSETPKDDADWDTIDKFPHNKFADGAIS
ncbi:MAG: Clp protease ClpP [Dysgonamonadaceae bacterium]|jgi:ATP-dependent protease ClpP protease subunit|nr:Clp protease ClpP [Dysgonamonadaceae bacterium]